MFGDKNEEIFEERFDKASGRLFRSVTISDKLSSQLIETNTVGALPKFMEKFLKILKNSRHSFRKTSTTAQLIRNWVARVGTTWPVERVRSS